MAKKRVLKLKMKYGHADHFWPSLGKHKHFSESETNTIYFLPLNCMFSAIYNLTRIRNTRKHKNALHFSLFEI